MRALLTLILHLATGMLVVAAKETPWALKPLVAPTIPAGHAARNPIDAFVRATLDAKGFAPSPEAEPRVLIRRIYFDLIGLPPEPREVEEFVTASMHDREAAVAALVDRLLASPRYGERWARHWMDAVHFAETHGHDQDRIREHAWPYRDYLIASLNADKPYARFIEEQVAGDVLFPDDPQATVALGFLAAGPWDESSLRDIREDTIDRQVGRYLDRDDIVTTVMSTFVSTTVHCARCHDHKFDPIPQEDYYALQAVFAGVDRANRTYDLDPRVHRERQVLLAQKRALERNDRAFVEAQFSGPQKQSALAKIVCNLRDEQAAWKVLEPDTMTSANGATLSSQPDCSILASGTSPDTDVYTVNARTGLSAITAIRLEVFADESLPHQGPGRQPENGNLHLSELALLAAPAGGGDPQPVAIAGATGDFNQESWTIANAVDGDEKTAWGIHPEEGRGHYAVFQLKEPLVRDGGAMLTVVLKQMHGRQHTIGRLRLAATSSPTPPAPLPAAIAALLTPPDLECTDTQRKEIAAYWLRRENARQLAALPAPQLVYAAASDFTPDGGLVPSKIPRRVQLLKRGDIRKPGNDAAPGALSCVSALPARFTLADPNDEASRRAALAKWLSDPRNTLTWRSIVNRVWHHHFGRGLVDTPNDLGKMGGVPSHPELLDWLAGWFRDEAGGSLKELHRLIVMSATYRQASHNAEPPTLTASDSDNRLLWRMNRQRLDAECVRDAMLQIGGQLDLRMGGPSDRQFELKPGIHVTPLVNYGKFDLDSAAGRRRSVYRFLFRTLPDPLMDALDCPAGDQLTAVRNASVTVQQAFAMWNSAFTARQSEDLAERLACGAPSVEAQVATACALVWNRPPNESEAAELVRFARQHGLANLCRLLFNSNEFMFVN